MIDTSKEWHVMGPAISLQEAESALVLRVGMAANALTSAKNFTRLVGEMPESPTKQMLMLQSLQLAVSYLKEATLLLKDNWTAVKHHLAQAVDVSSVHKMRCERLVDGTDPLRTTLQRVRSRLTFHWDEDEVKKWIRDYRDTDVVWLEGSGEARGQMVYTASADVIAERLLGVPAGLSRDELEKRLESLIVDLLEAIDAIHQAFDVYVGAFLNSQKVQLREGKAEGR